MRDEYGRDPTAEAMCCPVCGGTGVLAVHQSEIDYGSEQVNAPTQESVRELSQQLETSVITMHERRLRDVERRLSALDGGPMPPEWRPPLPEGEPETERYR